MFIQWSAIKVRVPSFLEFNPLAQKYVIYHTFNVGFTNFYYDFTCLEANLCNNGGSPKLVVEKKLKNFTDLLLPDKLLLQFAKFIINISLGVFDYVNFLLQFDLNRSKKLT